MRKKVNTRNMVIILIIIVAAIYIAIKIRADKPAPDATAIQQLEALTVSVVTPKEVLIENKIDLTGKVVAREDILVQTELQGLKVVDVQADEGIIVTKGQTLALLDKATLQAQSKQTDAQLKQSREDYKRVELLAESGAISAQEIDQKRAELSIKKAQAEDMNIQLKRSSVTAPENGLLYERNIRIGEVVNSSQSILFRIAKDNELELEVYATQNDIPYINIGTKAEMILGGRSIFSNVRLASPKVDETTKTARVRITIPQDVKAPVGSFGEAVIITDSEKVIALPKTAIIEKAGTNYVYIVNSSNKAVLTKIETGISNDSYTEIVPNENVHEGIKVIAKAGQFLKDGDLVNIANEKPEATNAD
jgi:HlyD family secretion protein